MEPIAIFSLGAVVLVSSLVVFFLVWKLSSRQPISGATDQAQPRQGQPIIVTASVIVAIGLFVASLFIGMEFLMPQSNLESSINQAKINSEDAATAAELDQLARKVDKAADQIYGGLDTTKDFIGKTEVRKQAIEQGRDHANKRLKSLAERIQAAAEQNQSLTPLDQKNATHITDGLN